MKPKLDKARREWLAGLKDGDEVAILTERGYWRAIVSRYYDEFSTGNGSGSYTLGSGQKFLRRGHSGYGSTPAWLVPPTDEMRATWRMEELRTKVKLAVGSLTNEQVVAIAAVLFPDPK